MAAPAPDLSFARYVAARKGADSARRRDGAGYAYAGDLMVRDTLAQLRPVTVAVEATVRAWQSVERARLLSTAIRVTERQFPVLHRAAVRCAEILQIPVPVLYLKPDPNPFLCETLGTGDDVFVTVSTGVLDQLSDAERLDVLGRECGHIQNDHAVYLTTVHFLEKKGGPVLRWAAKPATVALANWTRRAEITADRAGLLCTRDLERTLATRVKIALGSTRLSEGVDLPEYLAQLEAAAATPVRVTELLSHEPSLPKRIRALRLFAETTYWKSVLGQDDVVGTSKDECDARVAELLAVVWK